MGTKYLYLVFAPLSTDSRVYVDYLYLSTPFKATTDEQEAFQTARNISGIVTRLEIVKGEFDGN